MSIEVDGANAAKPRIPASRRWRMMGLTLGFLVCAVAVWGVFHRAGPAAPARAIGARLDLAAGDVTVTEAAAAGIARITGVRKRAASMSPAVVRVVSPVRPPASTPEADSM